MPPPPRVYDSCFGRCGDWANTNGSCYCDFDCLTTGDCCADYRRHCKVLPEKEAKMLAKSAHTWQAETQSFSMAMRAPKLEHWMAGGPLCHKASFGLYSDSNSCYNRKFADELVFPQFSDLSTGSMTYSNGMEVQFVEGLRIDVEQLCRFTNCSGFTCWSPKKYWYDLPEQACMSNDPRVYAKWQLCSEMWQTPPRQTINPGPRAPLWEMRCDDTPTPTAQPATLTAEPTLAPTNWKSLLNTPDENRRIKSAVAARVKEDVSRMDNEFATLAEAPGEDFRVQQDQLGHRNSAVVSSVENAKLEPASRRAKLALSLPGSALTKGIIHDGADFAGKVDSKPRQFDNMYAKIEQALLQQVPKHNVMKETIGGLLNEKATLEDDPRLVNEKATLKADVRRLEQDAGQNGRDTKATPSQLQQKVASILGSPGEKAYDLVRSEQRQLRTKPLHMELASIHNSDDSEQRLWEAARQMVHAEQIQAQQSDKRDLQQEVKPVKEGLQQEQQEQQQLWARAQDMVEKAHSAG